MNIETMLALAEELRLRRAWEEALYGETEQVKLKLAA